MGIWAFGSSEPLGIVLLGTRLHTRVFGWMCFASVWVHIREQSCLVTGCVGSALVGAARCCPLGGPLALPPAGPAQLFHLLAGNWNCLLCKRYVWGGSSILYTLGLELKLL